jgi:starvation-inducible outer membrane lipoprotein
MKFLYSASLVMNRKMLAMGAALVLAGCASLPAGWAEPERVLSSDANTITLQWRTWQISEAAVRAKAVLHCNGRPVQEVEAERNTRPLRMVRSKTWRCVSG